MLQSVADGFCAFKSAQGWRKLGLWTWAGRPEIRRNSLISWSGWCLTRKVMFLGTDVVSHSLCALNETQSTIVWRWVGNLVTRRARLAGPTLLRVSYDHGVTRDRLNGWFN